MTATRAPVTASTSTKRAWPRSGRRTSRGHHAAWSRGDLIRAFDEEEATAERQVFLGVTGIDGNPRVHPCASSSDCGDPDGNACDGTCGAVAPSAEACPEGTTWARFASGEAIIQGGACWR